jgi:hypothetical protein
MVLAREERLVFFSNFLRLLSFVNDKYDLVKDFGHPLISVGVSIKSVEIIKSKLWENQSVIDEYLETSKDLSEEDAMLVRSWKKNVMGPFFIVKHYKSGSIFFKQGNSGPALFQVVGITSPIPELRPDLPAVVDTTLMPFKDRITFDTLFRSSNVHYGSALIRGFNEEYKILKETKGIIKSLR